MAVGASFEVFDNTGGYCGSTGAVCNPETCIVKIFDVIASLYVNAFQYEYQSIHNGRPVDGGGQIDDTITGACFTENFDLEQMVTNICYIYRIERQFKADGLYLYRNASLDEPSAIVATIEDHELAVTDTAANGIRFALSTTYLDSSNAVTKVAFNFLDADNDFKPNQLTAKSPDAVQTDPEVQITLPFVMTVSEAETLVNRLIVDTRLSLIEHTFRLPPKYGWIGKGDVIVIKHGIFSDTVRLKQTDFNADKSQTCTAVTVASASTPVEARSYTNNRTQIGGDVVDSDPIFLDIPSPSPSESVGSDIAGYFEMYYSAAPQQAGYWLGAYFARQLTKDGEQYYTLFHLEGNPNKAGSFINRWRAANKLTDKRWITDTDTLQLVGGNGDWPTSRNTDKAIIDRNALLNMAVYGDVGRWEIIQFEKIENGIMSGIVRGLRGTEVHAGKHQPGDYIYTLGPNLVVSRIAQSYIGSKAKYRAVSNGKQFVLSEQIEAPAFEGNSRKPFAPYHYSGKRGSDGAITFTWLRRDRGGSGWGKALPLSESTLAFSVQVCDPSTGAVLRTLNATDTSVTYSAAQQSADNASNLSKFKLQVQQIGDAGAGFMGVGIVNV